MIKATKSLQVYEHPNGKMIIIRLPISNRTNLLHLFYAGLFLAGSIGFVSLLVGQWRDSIGASTIAALMVVACLVAFYRFINKATESEKLFVTKESLEIISTSLLKKNRKSFLLTEISDFKFIQKDRYDPHPLKGENFDYLGFQTEQQVTQDLHGEGRVSIFSKEQEVRFGRELASWDFSQLVVILYEITGKDFGLLEKTDKMDNVP